MVCSDPPEGRARWTVRLVAEEAVKRQAGSTRGTGNYPGSAPQPRPQAVAGKKCGAWPNSMTSMSPRWKTCWRCTKEPYNPSEPVVCLDEKPVTLHADVRPTSPASRGGRRGGTTSTNDAAPPMCSARWSRRPDDISPSRRLIARAVEFAHAVFEVAMQYPHADTIHLVMDNLNIHCRKSLTDLLRRRDRRRGLGSLHRPPHPQTR